MGNIKFYEISENYVDYLAPYAPYLYHNKKAHQQNSRKYIGVVLYIEEIAYFAPLSSFKEKHSRMRETLDFLKIKNYAVINLNSMFPVPEGCYCYVDIAKEKNPKYKSLLQAEYRFVKTIQKKIRNKAYLLYKMKIRGDNSPLTRRCNDFALLEELCKSYSSKR